MLYDLYNARKSSILKYLNSKKIVVLETDTLIGFSCIPDFYVVSELMKIKRKTDYTNPFILVASHIEHFIKYVDFNKLNDDYFNKLNNLNDVPTTFIVPATENYFSRGNNSIAIRLIRSGIVAEITHLLNSPIVSTSCNIHGKPPFTKITDIVNEFGKLPQVLIQGPYVLDNTTNKPSRIINLLTNEIIR